MKSRFWIVLVLFVMTACNLPSQTTVTPLATPVTATPASTVSTPTLIPIETLLARATATLVPTATPRISIASPIDQPVNCRYGPSTAYAVVGALDVDGQAEIVGKNIDVTWWVVKNPSDPSTYCWLAANVIDAVGNLDALPVVDAPPAKVSNIRVRIEPPSLNVACTAFPQYVTVNADITVNGPATVAFRWETSEGESIGADSLLFLEAGTQSAFIYYKIVAAKDYWIDVHILAPNDTSSRTTFKATCVP
ncbi:MAG: hypothetical protein ABI904_06985 [Chloroflexota bacterium]